MLYGIEEGDLQIRTGVLLVGVISFVPNMKIPINCASNGAILYAMAGCLGGASGLAEREQKNTTHAMRLKKNNSETQHEVSTNGGADQQTASTSNHDPPSNTTAENKENSSCNDLESGKSKESKKEDQKPPKKQYGEIWRAKFRK